MGWEDLINDHPLMIVLIKACIDEDMTGLRPIPKEVIVPDFVNIYCSLSITEINQEYKRLQSIQVLPKNNQSFSIFDQYSLHLTSAPANMSYSHSELHHANSINKYETTPYGKWQFLDVALKGFYQISANSGLWRYKQGEWRTGGIYHKDFVMINHDEESTFGQTQDNHFNSVGKSSNDKFTFYKLDHDLWDFEAKREYTAITSDFP